MAGRNYWLALPVLSSLDRVHVKAGLHPFRKLKYKGFKQGDFPAPAGFTLNMLSPGIGLDP